MNKNNKIQKYIQHLADQAPTYSYPQPQKIDKPTIEKSLQDNEEWEQSKDDEVTKEQAIGGFGPEHIQNSKHKCKPGYKW
jgi:hypothetical protein